MNDSTLSLFLFFDSKALITHFLLLSVDFFPSVHYKSSAEEASRFILLRDMEHELAFHPASCHVPRGRPWGLHHLHDELSRCFNSFKAFRGD
ncbi:hypothetical protein TNCV_1230371 [Trichonephila clavipes]|nr:hypothetical protein TNCV_1230371 [Trichonephila clavipes]